MSQEHPFLEVSEDLRTSYLIVLGAITAADRENSPEEIAFMEQMGLAAKLSPEATNTLTDAIQNTQNVNLKEHLEKFADNELRFPLMTDILNLVYADGELDPEEVQQLTQIKSVLSISEEQFDALQQYITAANKEAEQQEGNPELQQEGQQVQKQEGFLERVGISGLFEKVGIPKNFFSKGSTITAGLTGVVFAVLSNFMTSKQGAQAQQSNSGILGGLVSSFMGGQSQTTQQPQSGLAGMVSGFFSNESNAQGLSSLLGSVVGSVSKGKGLGNLANILSGGQKKKSGLQSILGSLLG